MRVEALSITSVVRRRDLLRLCLALPLVATLVGETSARAQDVGASLAGRQLFPADNPWNADISTAPVDPNSAALIASVGLERGLHPDFGTVWNGAPNGIPYVVVGGDQPKVPVTFQYAD